MHRWVISYAGSFEINWVRRYLVNFTGLTSIVNTTVYKTGTIFTGLGYGKLSQFGTLCYSQGRFVSRKLETWYSFKVFIVNTRVKASGGLDWKQRSVVSTVLWIAVETSTVRPINFLFYTNEWLLQNIQIYTSWTVLRSHFLEEVLPSFLYFNFTRQCFNTRNRALFPGSKKYITHVWIDIPKKNVNIGEVTTAATEMVKI